MRPSDITELGGLIEPLRSRAHAWLVAGAGRFWIGPGGGRRSIQQQVELRRRHCGTSFYDIWQKPSSQCNPPTARPSPEAPHVAGRAIDIEGDKAHAAALAPRYGLVFPVTGEDWHVEAAAGASTIQGLGGINLPGVGTVDPAGAVVDVIEQVTSPLLQGGKRLVLVGLLLAGGAALVVAGGARATGGSRR